MSALVVDRRSVVTGGVTPMRVVPTFDPFEDGHLRFCLALEATAVEQLALERSKETLCHRVVVCISHRAHRRHDARFAATLAERVARVLAAPIRMVNDFERPALREHHVELCSAIIRRG